nr:histidine phosphatase family protein [uncultured Oscillibacter sp.]
MTSIYLIRHAEAEGNLYRIAQGQYDSILTDRGWRQVRALERRFADVHIDGVYSSDLYRACATASAIYKPKGLPLHRVRALREICVGEWEQRTWGDICRQDPARMENFRVHPERWYVPGAETPRRVLDRALAALREIAGANDGRTVAVFSHGYVIRLVLTALQGYALDQLALTPVGDNTAVTLLEAEGDDLRVVFQSDNSHLQTPEFLAGEKIRRRANGLEPGLWFEPLRLPEQGDLLADFAAEGWADTGEGRTFEREKLLAGAAGRTTLVAHLEEAPVGIVQLGPDLGWISLACVRRACRRRSFGVQLLGQAVQHTRRQGGDRLFIALAAGGAAERFFRDYGFAPAGTAEDGRVVFQKEIGYEPEFLTKCGESAPL